MTNCNVSTRLKMFLKTPNQLKMFLVAIITRTPVLFFIITGMSTLSSNGAIIIILGCLSLFIYDCGEDYRKWSNKKLLRKYTNSRN